MYSRNQKVFYYDQVFGKIKQGTIEKVLLYNKTKTYLIKGMHSEISETFVALTKIELLKQLRDWVGTKIKSLHDQITACTNDFKKLLKEYENENSRKTHVLPPRR